MTEENLTVAVWPREGAGAPLRVALRGDQFSALATARCPNRSYESVSSSVAVRGADGGHTAEELLDWALADFEALRRRP
jgi:hypothetical protein